MSNISVNGIDPTFPVAGRDNDSVGFNQNFSAIVTALETAATEIGDLQSKALLKATLTENSSLSNDLGGNIISDGQFSQFSPVYADRGYTSPSSNDNTIDINNGPVQKFTVADVNNTGGDNFIWANWSLNANQFSKVTLIFTGTSSTLKNVTFSGTNHIYESTWPSPLQVSSSHLTVVEAWTVDGGDHVYLKVVGVY